MRAAAVARNYAEALFALAEQHGEAERYGELVDTVAGAIEADDHIRLVMESPRVPKATKSGLFRKALEGRAPDPFIRFLEAVVKRGRQGQLGGIAREYGALVDLKLNRVHAGIVMAREPDESLMKEVRDRLAEVFGKDVVPHFRRDPALLGGVLVRVGDKVMDGSVRTRMIRLRRHLLGI